MKALAVFSGGLDSLLSCAVVKSQGIDVQAIFFETPFFKAHRAKRYAEKNNICLEVVDITDEHLEIVKRPKYGYGINMNPCIDCHLLMIRKAGQMLPYFNASFIITGEVLNQRPMSQNRRALMLVAKESGYGDLLLRPLSAKKLPPTLPEREGWIDRERLLAISGRSRKIQIQLASEYHIRDYPSPAGGCLLTDPVFSQRLRDLLSYKHSLKKRDVELLKLGRHFRTPAGAKIIVGRNRKENMKIQELSTEEDILIHAAEIPGPTVLLMDKKREEDEILANELSLAYSDTEEGKEYLVVARAGESIRKMRLKARSKAAFRHYMV